jgi:hypothetical protein
VPYAPHVRFRTVIERRRVMGRQRRRVGLLGAAFAVLGLYGVAQADVTSERSGSILVFPKVLADGTRDTIIQISNTSNSLVRAHCFYVNAALTDPSRPQGPLNPPLWQEIDFDINLTRQQPTYWRVSTGRNVNPTDPPCSQGNANCPNSGFDPGLIPPVVPDFVGELKCVQVDDSGAPLSGNSFKGEATLVRLDDGDISQYNAVAILGIENTGDGILVLGGGQCAGNGAVCGGDDDCGGDGPCVPEYNACPQTWIVNHQPEDAPNLIFGNGSAVSTELTIVPCTQNYETQIPTAVTLQFLTYNEFESQFSVSTTVTCWGNFNFRQLGSPVLTIEGTQVLDPQGTMFMQSRIRAAAGTPFGIIMVAEELHSYAGGSAWAAMNSHMEGDRPNPDIITIPGEQIAP